MLYTKQMLNKCWSKLNKSIKTYVGDSESMIKIHERQYQYQKMSNNTNLSCFLGFP